MPKTIILVSCGQQKADKPCKAKDMYTSTLFKAARAYAEKFGDYWFVLSARQPDKFGDTCGWIHPDTVIKPYNRTLKGMGSEDVNQWAAWCQADFASFILEHPEHYQRPADSTKPGQYGKVIDLRIEILAGETYVEPLRSKGFGDLLEEPLKGMQIGERIQWLQQQVRGVDAQRQNSRSTRGEKGRLGLQLAGAPSGVSVDQRPRSGKGRRSGQDPHEPI